MARILALDLSTNCGFCIGDVEADGPPEQFGFWKLAPYAERGRMMAGLRNSIEDMRNEMVFYRVAIEQRPPASRFAGRTNSDSTDQQAYLEACVFQTSYDQGWGDPEIVSPRLARSRVFGSYMTNITQKEKTDGVLVRKLQAMGHKVYDHNAADALTIWLWLQMKAHGKKKNVRG